MTKPRNETGSTDDSLDLTPLAAPATPVSRNGSENGRAVIERSAASLHVQIVPIDSVRPMPGNARAHGPRDLAALRDSLTAHGQCTPIVVKAEYRETERAILKGYGTWTAMKQLGRTDIAVVWFEGTDDDAAAYSVRDNRTAELSRWDASALAALAADADLDLLALGWNAPELGDLLRGTDAKTPRFEPIEQPAHRLDQLADETDICPNCGYRRESR